MFSPSPSHSLAASLWCVFIDQLITLSTVGSRSLLFEDTLDTYGVHFSVFILTPPPNRYCQLTENAKNQPQFSPILFLWASFLFICKYPVVYSSSSVRLLFCSSKVPSPFTKSAFLEVALFTRGFTGQKAVWNSSDSEINSLASNGKNRSITNVNQKLKRSIRSIFTNFRTYIRAQWS